MYFAAHFTNHLTHFWIILYSQNTFVSGSRIYNAPLVNSWNILINLFICKGGGTAE
jgi:hypothetical protein